MRICGISNSVIEKDIELIINDASIDWGYLRGKTVLVTGANGFIPSYIVYTLLGLNERMDSENQISILALVRNKEKAEKKFASLLRDEKLKFKLIVADVSTPICVPEKIDVIIHAASQASPKYYGIDPVGTLKANTLGTANMLDLAREAGVEKFLFVSSGEVYGVPDGNISSIDETDTGNVDITNVRSCYAESKRMGETMCVCWAHQFRFHVNMLRLAHTYGPGVDLEDGRVFADFARNVINGEDIVLHSDGTAKRSFLYISDMIRALFTVLLSGGNKQAYNVAADNETEIGRLAEMLCGLYPEKHLTVKYNLGEVPAGYIRSSSGNLPLSNEKLKKLGWKPHVDIREGFRRMIESYQGCRYESV